MSQINASKQITNKVGAELVESFKATESRQRAFLEELQDILWHTQTLWYI